MSNQAEMNRSKEIISYIANATKTTPFEVYVNWNEFQTIENVKYFGNEQTGILVGNWDDIKAVVLSDKVKDYHLKNDRRNSGVPLLDYTKINARIEPGVFIREKVEIGDNAVIMMGAVINIGATIGERTMIDMNAVLGGRASVGKGSHIGAGAVLAGVIEPISAQPVRVGDNVLIGANAVVLEGVQIGDGAIVGANSVVTKDVPANAVVVGSPARIVKTRDEVDAQKIEIIEELR